MAPRAATVWYALLVNAGMRRSVLASSTARRVRQPAAFIGTAMRRWSSSSSSSSDNFISGRIGRGRGWCVATDPARGSCFPGCPSLHHASRYATCCSWVQQPRRGLAINNGLCTSTPTSPSLQEGGGGMLRGAERRALLCSAAAGSDTSVDAEGKGGSDVAREAMRVTLLSGFLGAGKTTLMRKVLRQARDERLSLAVIVNDMADVNIDAQLLARSDGEEGNNRGAAGSRGGLAGDSAAADVRSVGTSNDDDKSVAMQDGCICCTLRDDLLLEVEAIASEGKYEHLIIESTGISDPMPVAEALVTSGGSSDSRDYYFADGDSDEEPGGATEGARVRGRGGAGGQGGKGEARGLFSLDTLVTVVDSTSFLDEVRKADDLEERGLEAEEGDTRTIADLLISQVEFANVILLNKADLAAETDMATLEGLVRRLNPAARVVRTVSSDVGLAEVVGTGRFDFDEASQAAGWVQALNDDAGDDDVGPAGHAAAAVTAAATRGSRAAALGDHDHNHNHDHGCNHAEHNHDRRQDEAESSGHGREEHAEQHDCEDHGGGGHSHGNGGHDHDGHDHRHTSSSSSSSRSSFRRAENFGIGSFTYRARRPFHPERLMAFVMGHLPSVLRSKGFLWLATRHDTAGVWNQAGGSFATENGGSWDEEDSRDDDGDDGSGGGNGREEQGQGQGRRRQHPGRLDRESKQVVAADDRGAGVGDDAESGAGRNELVFIGLGMDEPLLKAELHRCLLTDEEMADGPEAWKERFSDPFPPWE